MQTRARMSLATCSVCSGLETRLAWADEDLEFLDPVFLPKPPDSRLSSRSLICFRMPTSSSSTLCWMPADVSMNFTSQLVAKRRPSEIKVGTCYCQDRKWSFLAKTANLPSLQFIKRLSQSERTQVWILSTPKIYFAINFPFCRTLNGHGHGTFSFILLSIITFFLLESKSNLKVLPTRIIYILSYLSVLSWIGMFLGDSSSIYLQGHFWSIEFSMDMSVTICRAKTTLSGILYRALAFKAIGLKSKPAQSNCVFSLSSRACCDGRETDMAKDWHYLAIPEF